LFVSACGRNAPNEERQTLEDFIAGLETDLIDETEQAGQTDTTPSSAVARAPGGKLTVLAPGHFRPILERAATLMEYERDFELEITLYNPEEDSIYWAHRLQTMFATGDSFDLIFTDPLFPMWDFARAGYLTEINSLISRCVLFNRDDFYEEALRALTIDDRLYFFPLGFGFQYVSINTMVPQEFINRFNQQETITVSQMIDMYMEIRASGQEIVGLWGYEITSMVNCRDLSFPGFMAWNAISDFVDIGSRTSNLLDAEFVSFLEQIRIVFPTTEDITSEKYAMNNLRYNSIGMGFHLGFYDGSPGNMNIFYDNMFLVSNEFLRPIGAIVPFTVDTEFEGFIPLVDRQGRRKSNMGVTYPWKMVSIPQGNNDLLAWEFVTRHLIPASLCYTTNQGGFWPYRMVYVHTNLGEKSFDSPIIKDLMESHFTDIFERTKTRYWRVMEPVIGADGFIGARSFAVRGMPFAGIYDATPAEQELTIADAIRRIDEINNSLISPVPLIPFELFEPAIHQLLRRIITPEDAARHIHEAVNQWLQE